jgi:hypothetical protein
MTRRVGVDVFTIELHRAEGKDAQIRDSHVPYHDVEVKLLWHGRVWPRGLTVTGSELER